MQVNVVIKLYVELMRQVCAFQPPYRRSDSSEASRYPSLFDNVDDERRGHRDNEQVCWV